MARLSCLAAEVPRGLGPTSLFSQHIDGCMKTTTGVVPELEQNFRLHANAALPPGPRRGARVGAAAGEVRRAALRCEV